MTKFVIQFQENLDKIFFELSTFLQNLNLQILLDVLILKPT